MESNRREAWREARFQHRIVTGWRLQQGTRGFGQGKTWGSLIISRGQPRTRAKARKRQAETAKHQERPG